MAKLSFETKMIKLEQIAAQLEDGDLSLEQSLKLYEDGVKLADEIEKELIGAELKIKELSVKNDGGDDE